MVHYGDYLQLEKILDAQQPESDKLGEPAHDEMLFIVIHQAYELWFKQLLFETGSVIDILQQPALNGGGTCLTIGSQGHTSSACIVLPVDVPVNTPMPFSIETLAKNLFPPLRLLNGVFPDQSGPASRIYLADDFAGRGINPSLVVYAATLGTEVGGPVSTERPAIWLGGLIGNIFKISTDTAGSSVSITRLNVPFAATIKFVAFVSPERGWIWTPSAGERGAPCSHAAAGPA